MVLLIFFFKIPSCLSWNFYSVWDKILRARWFNNLNSSHKCWHKLVVVLYYIISMHSYIRVALLINSSKVNDVIVYIVCFIIYNPHNICIVILYAISSFSDFRSSTFAYSTKSRVLIIRRYFIICSRIAYTKIKDRHFYSNFLIGFILMLRDIH